MKQSILLACLLVAGFMSQAQKFVINDRNAEIRSVSSFTGVKISSAIDLYLSQGDENAVAVSASDPGVRARIKTEVKNGVLSIWFDSRGWGDWKGNKNMKAYVSVKTLESLKADGACDVNLMGKIRADKLSVDLDGASDIKGELDCNELNMDVSGASDTRLKGNIGTIAVKISGASSIKGWDLVADFCAVDASGASSMNVVVNKELKVKASGASDINYRGNGVIREMRSSGASSINRKDG